jgi:3',5'-cyclic-AMP phosphodiesterase
MTFRIAHISDTHLSGDKPFFAANFARVAAHISADPPDLVINTGDMALDGPSRDSDLAEARRLHDAIGVPCRFIPGNHDLGESLDSPAHPALLPISEERRARYLRLFGPDFWQLDVLGWRLLAIDAQLLGSDLQDAAAQLEFLREAVDGSGDRRIALFVHKPLFHVSPDEEVVGGRFVNPVPRRQLLDIFKANPPALVCSGHVHQYFSTQCRGMHCVWAPSTGFILPDTRQPTYGLKQVGYVEHRLGADGAHDSRFVIIPALECLSIADFPQAYGIAE